MFVMLEVLGTGMLVPYQNEGQNKQRREHACVFRTGKERMKNRKNIRLQKYDYSQEGYYFVTICTNNREHLFGELDNGEMELNDEGKRKYYF